MIFYRSSGTANRRGSKDTEFEGHAFKVFDLFTFNSFVKGGNKSRNSSVSIVTRLRNGRQRSRG
jgi:hypothetical protein